jgi:hypothetical protein
MTFDGIDLEDLANSESPIVESTRNETEDNEATEGIGNPESNDTEDTENGIDLDLIASIGEETENNTQGDNDNDEGELDTKDPAKKDTATSSSQKNTFTSLASALFEDGSLNSLTKEDADTVTDAASLLELINKQIKNNEFADLTDNQKQYLEALATGVPHESYAQTKANADQYSKISDEHITNKPELGKELIKRSFLIKGFDVTQATKYAELAAKEDSFQEDAMDARNALVAFENSRLEEDVKARKQKLLDDSTEAEKQLAKLKSKVTETSEVIPGIKVNSATREKIFKSMTTPTKVTDDNPLNEVMDKYQSDQEYKMRLHALDVITKGFTDFSSFTKKASSTAAQKLEEQIAQGGAITTGSSMKAGGVVSASQTEIRNALDSLKL